MLFRSPQIGSILGVDIFLHWTMWMLPVFILSRGLFLYSYDEALLQVALVGAVYACLAFHEIAHLLVARQLGLGLRDLTLYPIGGISRLAVVGERPWQEVWIATAGPVAHVLIGGVIAAVFIAADRTLSPRVDSPHPYLETFFNRLFWLNVLLAILHVLPAFPLDGGRIFRGALALSAGRLRATEVGALLSSFVALTFLVPGMIWMGEVWWLIAMGIIIHVGGQQELMSVRYFASLQEPDLSTPATPPLTASIEQLVDESSRPAESDFNGLTWNRKNRLWIVWRNGEPVSANALVGE